LRQLRQARLDGVNYMAIKGNRNRSRIVELKTGFHLACPLRQRHADDACASARQVAQNDLNAVWVREGKPITRS
jgi:hypothetical protein